MQNPSHYPLHDHHSNVNFFPKECEISSMLFIITPMQQIETNNTKLCNLSYLKLCQLKRMFYIDKQNESLKFYSQQLAKSSSFSKLLCQLLRTFFFFWSGVTISVDRRSYISDFLRASETFQILNLKYSIVFSVKVPK